MSPLPPVLAKHWSLNVLVQARIWADGQKSGMRPGRDYYSLPKKPSTGWRQDLITFVYDCHGFQGLLSQALQSRHHCPCVCPGPLATRGHALHSSACGFHPSLAGGGTDFQPQPQS